MNPKLASKMFKWVLVLVLGLLIMPSVLFGAPGSAKQAAKFEIRFMENMIDHHMMAVMQAEICLEKAIHEELHSLCENIITTQTAEIQQMQTWLLTWYGIEYESQMSPGEMQQVEKLAELEGAEFEIEFLKTMMMHHRMAIMESRMVLKRAYHEELRQLARNIIMTQSAEIKQMQTWLCVWYEICHHHMMMGMRGM